MTARAFFSVVSPRAEMALGMGTSSPSRSCFMHTSEYVLAPLTRSSHSARALVYFFKAASKIARGSPVRPIASFRKLFLVAFGAVDGPQIDDELAAFRLKTAAHCNRATMQLTQ